MIVNPLRLYRRRRRLNREALEEAQYLRRRHGDDAVAVARDKLRRPDLTTWGRRVLVQTVTLLMTRI